MNNEKTNIDARCRDLRKKFPAFFKEELGPVATGEIRGHLLACEDCSGEYSEFVFREVQSHPELIKPAPQVPPISWYTDNLREEGGLFGVLWSSVTKALKSETESVRQKAAEQLRKFQDALNGMVIEPEPVKTRGPGREPLPITGVLLDESRETTGGKVPFTVEEHPKIRDGHFRMSLKSPNSEYRGYTVLCTVMSNNEPAMTYEMSHVNRSKSTGMEVAVDVPNVSKASGNIPLNHIRLFIVKEWRVF